MLVRSKLARCIASALLWWLATSAPIDAQQLESGSRALDERSADEVRRSRRDEPFVPRPDEATNQFREFRGPGGSSGFRGYEPPSEITVKEGFLFIDDRYIAPPYEIKLAENVLTVNGQPLECVPPARNYGGYGSRGSGSRPGESSWRYIVGEMASQLGSNLAVFSFKSQPYVVFDSSTTYDLLKTITTEGGRAVRQISVREQLPPDFDKAVWDAWTDRFEPPGELLQRAAVLVNDFEDTQRKAEADMRATRLLNRLAYPLAVGGMVLSVFALGHLLGGRPHARQRLIGQDDSPEMLHSLNWSLAFVVAFSTLDLAWTILAANAGQMQELNPIGSHLVGNPRHLAGFKMGITLPSLALIWLLRRYKRAQVAAWWLCLILTFVTLRWLTISPLMAPA